MTAKKVSPSELAARRLYAELLTIRDDLQHAEKRWEPVIAATPLPQRMSVRNLVHYLALRQRDLRKLQGGLSDLGLSSLGRCEAQVMANVDQVLFALGALAGIRVDTPVENPSGTQRLRRQAIALLGKSPAQREARIMVTLPSEAATDARLVDELFAAGMDLVRINCAHDGETAWSAMLQHVRKASKKYKRTCPVLMDLGGPKLRTGAIAPGDQVVAWSPRRDHHGRVVQPARVGLVPVGAIRPAGCDAWIPLSTEFIAACKLDDLVELSDARNKSRCFPVVQCDGHTTVIEATATTYVEPGTRIRLLRGKKLVARFTLGNLPPLEQPLMLVVGDHIRVTASQDPGQPALRDPQGKVLVPACIPCSLPEVLVEVRAGERIWFDDGKIGGMVRQASADELLVEITQAKTGGARLRSDKGINLPDSSLTLPCLTADDQADLAFAHQHADLIGLSFVRRPEDIDTLVAALGRKRPVTKTSKSPGIVLKIETPQAFADLPAILFRALRAGRVGVMIARGDLAVEVGFTRLAEVQEEILWLCEAAHLPVIWGTQVLESLAKKGRATRAEVTDAAMSVRAECVMLNKGPYVVSAVSFLSDILTRMHAHQVKKRTLLRSLSVSHPPPVKPSLKKK